MKPGFYIEINLRTKETTEICYWDAYNFYNAEPLNISFDESKVKLHELLKSACEYRMVADTEVGIFLSGGFDSSLVTAILQRDRHHKINTFSIGFEEEEFNEAPYAKSVAAYLGTNHHEVICTVKDALDIIPSLPFYYDEPFGDSSAIPTMLVSQFASKHVKVALSADGGDEVFGGYPKYHIKMDYLTKLQSIPSIFKRPLAKMLSVPFFQNLSQNPHHEILMEKLKGFVNQNDSREVFRYRSEPYHFSHREIKDLLVNGANSSLSPTFYDNYRLGDHVDPSMLMMALEYKTILVDDMLVKIDRATMASSLEGREPFLDHRLLEFSSRLNASHHFKNNKTKSLIRQISYDYIPQALLDRPKKGFSIPTNKWLHNELKDLVMELSSRPFIQNQNIFDFKSCNSMIRNYYRGIDKNGERIWFFLMFQLWYKEWITV